jgi:murein DD-endopeptidase MepM/ murein hydrolase activator NlpD
MKIKISNSLNHINDRRDLLQDFIVFVSKDLQCMPCDVDIVDGRGNSGLTTTAQYDPNNHHITVNGKNRQFGDVLRSVAHEMVHHKQNVNGELGETVQDVGGNIEDEANARAGELLKSFAYQTGPERIYEGRELMIEALPSAEDLTKAALIAALEKAKVGGARLRDLSIDKLKKLYKKFAEESTDPDEIDDEARKRVFSVQQTREPTMQTDFIPTPLDIEGNDKLNLPVSIGALRVTSDYKLRTRMIKGKSVTKFHYGVDIGGNTRGHSFPVLAAGEGTVYSVGEDNIGRDRGTEASGAWVAINYRLKGERYRIKYGHLAKPVHVAEKETVVPGQQIGIMGSKEEVGVWPHVHVGVLVPKIPQKDATDEVFGQGAPFWKYINPDKLWTNLPPEKGSKPNPSKKAPDTAEVPTQSIPIPKTGPIPLPEESKSKKESVLESYIRAVILEANDAESKDAAPDPKKKLDTPTKSRITKSKAIDIDAIRAIVRESLTTYGVGHTDPTNGGPGRAYRLGVDYKNASTNIPHVGTGYVDRTHSLPYEVRLRTNQDAKQIYDTVFADGINTAAMNLTPDQVSYNPDGLKLQCHIATGRDSADERDVKLISQEIYKSMMGSPGKAKDAIFDIEVEPVNTKIRR